MACVDEKEIDQDEILALNGINLSEFDEFAQRRKMKEAESRYKFWKNEVLGASEFCIDVVEKLGEYDFKAKKFPLILPDTRSCLVSSYTQPVGTNTQPYILEPAAGPDIQHFGEPNYYLIFDIPEDIRAVEVNEKKAEKLMPRINSFERNLTLEIRLKPATTQDAAGKKIFFIVKKIIVILPRGMGSGDASGGQFSWDKWLKQSMKYQEALANQINGKVVHVPPPPPSVFLKTWVPPEKAKWIGTNVAGLWKGYSEEAEMKSGMTGEERTTKVDWVLDLKQSRNVLYGNMEQICTVPDLYYPSTNPPSVNKYEHPFFGSLTDEKNFIWFYGDSSVYKYDGNIDGEDHRAINLKTIINGEGAGIKLTRSDANNSNSIGESTNPAESSKSGISTETEESQSNNSVSQNGNENPTPSSDGSINATNENNTSSKTTPSTDSQVNPNEKTTDSNSDSTKGNAGDTQAQETPETDSSNLQPTPTAQE